MSETPTRSGPLAGVKIVEFAGIGPAPLAAMLLADLGATVIRIDRKTASDLGVPSRGLQFDLTMRNRRAIRVDLKDPAAVAMILDLIEQADAIIEGFRPGVMERLGLGPDVCLQRNPKLVYGRVTGWGQEGPLAKVAGHDLNYISITGILNAIGRAGQPPTPPLNALGDYAGGTMYLVFGVLAAMLQARASGQGQVVDAAMVDGVVSLMTMIFGMHASGRYHNERGSNMLDSGAHFYDVYACADGKYISFAAVEKKFYDQLLERVGLKDHPQLQDHLNPAQWQVGKQILTEKFKERTREEWTALLGDLDVCFAPVLDFDEVPQHPHMKARGALMNIDGVMHPAPAPRFSHTPAARPVPPQPMTTENAVIALQDWLTPEKIASLQVQGTFV